MSPRLVPTALAVALSVAASAADADPSIILVETQREPLTTSTASAAETELGLVPGGTDVVSGDEIRKGRTATWRDALGMSPGVHVQPRYGSEEARLSIRGSGVQRTFHLRGIRLLADGQPISLADGGGDFQATDFALADHVAVWRGANALAYGGATLGGAIDVVSPTGLSAPGGSVRLEGGSFGYGKAVVTSGGSDGDVDAWIGVSSSRQVGYRDHSHQDNVRVQGNLGWRFAPGVENRLFGAYADSDSELPGSITRAQMEDDPEQANSGSALRDSKRDYPLYRIADRLAIDWGETRAEASLAWMRKELFHPLAFGLIAQDSDDWVAATRLVDDHRLGGRGNRFVLGAEAGIGVTEARTYGYAAAVGNTPGAISSDALQTARSVAIYGEWRHEAAASLWLVGGAQAQWTELENDDRLLVAPSAGDQSGSKIWTSLNPKLGVLWQARPEVAAFANLSKSSEPPSFAEYIQRDLSLTTRPQQDLAAQSAWTAEIGTRGSVERVAWDLTAYYAEVRDEYLAVQLGPGVTVTQNADATVHQGVEAGLDLRLWGPESGDDPRLTLLQTYTWGRFHFDGDAQWGDNQLPGLPEHVWRGELRFEQAGWYAAATAEYQAGWPVDFANTFEAESSVLLGARAGFDRGRGFSAFIEGRNLTDEVYAATTGVANPATAADTQALFNPGDGLAVNAGAAWRW